VPGELTVSLLHEYGHVIAEWAHKRSPVLSDMIASGWPGRTEGRPWDVRPWDEERFAEDFAQWIFGGGFVYGDETLLRDVVRTYATEAFEPE
jgi:hypothetical protein